MRRGSLSGPCGWHHRGVGRDEARQGLAPADLVRGLLEGQQRIAVTGASGWLGRVTLYLLARALGPEAFATRVTAFASRPRPLALPNGLTADARHLGELAGMAPAPTHLLHYAFVLADRLPALGVDGFVRANLSITQEVVRAVDLLRPEGFFYASSGAVYDRRGGFMSDVDRDPYGALKRLDELAFRQACRDAGTACVVARVFNLAGPHMSRPRSYALGDLVARALAGEPLLVRARGPVRRSYAAAEDVAALALAEVLRPGQTGDVVFDAAGEEVIEVGDLAVRVGRALGRPELAVVRELDPAAPADDYYGDGAVLRRLAARHGLALAPLDEQIRSTAAGLGA